MTLQFFQLQLVCLTLTLFTLIPRIVVLKLIQYSDQNLFLKKKYGHKILCELTEVHLM